MIPRSWQLFLCSFPSALGSECEWLLGEYSGRDLLFHGLVVLRNMELLLSSCNSPPASGSGIAFCSSRTTPAWLYRKMYVANSLMRPSLHSVQ